MGGEDGRDEYERSLGEWRARLQASLPQSPEGVPLARDTLSTPRLPYTPRYAYSAARSLGQSHTARQHAPLIDKVTNSWQDEKVPEFHVPEPTNFCDLEDEGSCPNTTRDLVKTRRFRRMVVFIIVVSLVLYHVYQWYVRPRFQEEWDLKEGFLPGRTNGTYGLARAGDFDGTRSRELDSRLLPGGKADPEGKRRLVFVGDVHGCKDELVRVLEKAGFNPNTDHLVATGDVVSKGPHNTGVLDELIRLKAESVRGNHEDRLLEAAKTLLTGDDLPPPTVAATSHGYAKDAALLKQLKPKHMKYLRDMPLMLHIPALPLAKSGRKDGHRISEDIIVAHAGIVPHVPLAKQDPYFVMNMRSIDDKTHMPSALRTAPHAHHSRPWMELWNWYNDRLFRGRPIKGFHAYTVEEWHAELEAERKGWQGKFWDVVSGKAQPKPKPKIVVYGHDSKAGLQLHRWSKGLDSGCVAGGNLTALVLDAKGRTEVVQVRCKDYKA